MSHYFHLKYHLNSAKMVPSLNWDYSDSEVSPLHLIMKPGNPIFQKTYNIFIIIFIVVLSVHTGISEVTVTIN